MSKPEPVKIKVKEEDGIIKIDGPTILSSLLNGYPDSTIIIYNDPTHEDPPQFIVYPSLKSILIGMRVVIEGDWERAISGKVNSIIFDWTYPFIIKRPFHIELDDAGTLYLPIENNLKYNTEYSIDEPPIKTPTRFATQLLEILSVPLDEFPVTIFDILPKKKTEANGLDVQITDREIIIPLLNVNYILPESLIVATPPEKGKYDFIRGLYELRKFLKTTKQKDITTKLKFYISKDGVRRPLLRIDNQFITNGKEVYLTTFVSPYVY